MASTPEPTATVTVADTPTPQPFGAKPDPIATGRVPDVSELRRMPIRGQSQQFGTKTLLFSPYAWAKLVYMRDLGPTEISGWAICGDPDDLLYVTDFRMVKQCNTSTFTEMDEDSIAMFVYEQTMAGVQVNQCQRIWVHTHPNMSPTPSGQDERMFETAFANTDWGVMFILATSGDSYCRLRHNSGLKMQTRLDVEVCWRGTWPAANPEAWLQEYLDCVTWRTYAPTVVRQDVTPPPTPTTTPTPTPDPMADAARARATIDLLNVQSGTAKLGDLTAADMLRYLLDSRRIDLERNAHHPEGLMAALLEYEFDDLDDVLDLLEQYDLHDLVYDEAVQDWYTVESCILAGWHAVSIEQGINLALEYDEIAEDQRDAAERRYVEEQRYAQWDEGDEEWLRRRMQ